MAKLVIVILLLNLGIELSKSQQLSSFDIFRSNDVMIVGETSRILLKLGSHLNQSVKIDFIENQANLIQWLPKSILVPQNLPNSSYIIEIDAKKAGSVEVTGTSTPKNAISDFNLFFKITIGHSRGLIIASLIVGWTYFLFWGISNYPQVWLNFKRKSVVGFSFDFLALNIVGHVCYSIFNVCFYFEEYFQEEYLRRFPHGQIPVLLNDVFYITHEVFVYIIVVLQCIFYQRGSQKISFITWTLIGIFLTIIITVGVFCSINALHWLDFLYTCSYIKLAVEITKYIPQVVLNYKRKSTVGWSIELILLDTAGGILSILQMIINAYNYDDWQSNFGNPSKLLLGLLNIVFGLIFIVQHYCLYKNSDCQHEEPNNYRNLDIKVVGSDLKNELFLNKIKL